MAITMFSASVPVFRHMLNNLSHILAKAQAHVTAHGIEESALITFRLYPDMFPFARHIQIACDAATTCVARISEVEAPVFEKNYTTFADLKDLVAGTLAYLSTVPALSMDGTEEKSISFMVRGSLRTMNAEAYMKMWAMANLFFHISTAYLILRHNGVERGKLDFLDG